MAADDELVRVGRVVKPHGIRGEFVVEPDGDTLGRLAPGDQVFLAGEPRFLRGTRLHQGRVLLAVEGCLDRDAAEAQRGHEVQVLAAVLPPPAEGQWYADDLIGWAVFDAQGKALGTVHGVLPGAAHDYLQLDEAGAVLVPMVREWLLSADAERRELRVDVPPGLLELDAD